MPVGPAYHHPAAYVRPKNNRPRQTTTPRLPLALCAFYNGTKLMLGNVQFLDQLGGKRHHVEAPTFPVLTGTGLGRPPGESNTSLDRPSAGEGRRGEPRSLQRILEAHQLSRLIASARSSVELPEVREKLKTSSASTVDPPAHAVVPPSVTKEPNPGAAHPAGLPMRRGPCRDDDARLQRPRHHPVFFWVRSPQIPRRPLVIGRNMQRHRHQAFIPS